MDVKFDLTGVSAKIRDIAQDNRGLITSGMAAEAGISRGSLKYMVDKGELERVLRGIYSLPEWWEDDFYITQLRFKKGIYSLETALFLFDLTDRTPDRLCMTFPSSYNLSNAKEANVEARSSSPKFYGEGIVEAETPFGNLIKAYCMERTLCEILQKRSGVDADTVASAFKAYIWRKDRNIPLLSRYAKQFKVEEKVCSYLEVLL